jgi:branched-chain amino acid transport system ATP-binding protein
VTALLSLSRVSVSFGGLNAVDDVSFDVRHGEIFGLIGPNGAGKSTLFNAISGLTDLSDGSVWLDAINISRLPARKRMQCGIQRTFQSVQLVKSISVLENILLGMSRRISLNPFVWIGRGGFESRSAAGLAHEIANQVGLSAVVDTVVDRLPYREQRLCEIGRAIASAPLLLLLDEPAAGLSEGEIHDLNTLIRDLRVTFGLTVLLVEHVMPLVMGLCDRVAVLDAGKLLTVGSPNEVAADRRVVAAYLGASYA